MNINVVCTGNGQHPKHKIGVLVYERPLSRAEVDLIADATAKLTPHEPSFADEIRNGAYRRGLSYLRRHGRETKSGRWQRRQFDGIRAVETPDGRAFEFVHRGCERRDENGRLLEKRDQNWRLPEKTVMAIVMRKIDASVSVLDISSPDERRC